MEIHFADVIAAEYMHNGAFYFGLRTTHTQTHIPIRRNCQSER